MVLVLWWCGYSWMVLVFLDVVILGMLGSMVGVLRILIGRVVYVELMILMVLVWCGEYVMYLMILFGWVRLIVEIRSWCWSWVNFLMLVGVWCYWVFGCWCSDFRLEYGMLVRMVVKDCFGSGGCVLLVVIMWWLFGMVLRVFEMRLVWCLCSFIVVKLVLCWFVSLVSSVDLLLGLVYRLSYWLK